MKSILPFLLGTCLLTNAAYAHEDGVHHAEAHIHGSGELFLELSGKELTLQLTAPKANFLLTDGSLVDHDSLPAANLFLALPDNAKCENLSLTLDTGTAQPEPADMDHHEHDAEEDSHSHDTHDEHDDHTEHADYTVTGSWTCAKPDKANNLDLVFLKTFTGFENVKLIFLDGDDMMAKTATPDSTKITRR